MYEILNVATSFDGENLNRESSAALALETGSDVYVKVRITVDSTKHVQPIVQTQVQEKPVTASKIEHEVLKYKTITKYSYYESGEKYVKVLLSDLAGLDKHPKDKITVDF